MHYQDILDGIKNPEKEITEFKLSFNDRDGIGKTMAAFSTNKGGRIWVGIDKNGIPIGVKCKDDIDVKIQDLARVVKPHAIVSTKIVPHNSKKQLYIVCIEVEKGQGVYCYKQIPYLRRGETNYALNPDELFEIQKSTKKLYYDEQGAYCPERPALISDIDINKIDRYYEMKGKTKPEGFNLTRFLINHDLLFEDSRKVRNATIMLFGNDPNYFIPHLKISYCQFSSNEVTKEDFLKKEFCGDLFESFQKTYIEIKSAMSIYSSIEEYKRVDVPEYPPEVIREALINAIVHRDYFDRTTETFVKKFSNRIEITNPASFPFENYSFEEIERAEISVRRNPLIAQFFEDMHLMEKEGRGLTFMKNESRKHGLPEPTIEVGKKTFKIIFHSAITKKENLFSSPYRSVKDFSNLNDRQKIFIEHMINNSNLEIRRKDYEVITNSKERTANRDLADLVEKDFIKKRGKGANVAYRIQHHTFD